MTIWQVDTLPFTLRLIIGKRQHGMGRLTPTRKPIASLTILFTSWCSVATVPRVTSEASIKSLSPVLVGGVKREAPSHLVDLDQSSYSPGESA